MNRGYLFAIAAYAMWGLLPIYWRLLSGIPATQLVAHRIVWSSVCLVVLVILGKQWTSLKEALGQREVLIRQPIAAILVCANWLLFIWAVTHGRIIECSLGYFINPLMSVLLAVAILGERLNARQWFALGVAAVGVLWLTYQYGTVPWIAVLLAITFCFYSLVKKATKIHPIVSLSIETWSLLIPAVAYLIYEQATGSGAWMTQGLSIDGLLVISGLATTAPLLCFAAGAQRIPLSAIGLLQYVGPTLQFLLGTLVYGEPFDRQKLIGFVIVWLALALYVADGFLRKRSASE